MHRSGREGGRGASSPETDTVRALFRLRILCLKLLQVFSWYIYMCMYDELFQEFVLKL